MTRYLFKNQFSCLHCGQINDRNSNNQKYCSRSDNPECNDDRHFMKLWQLGKHPIQLIIKSQEYGSRENRIHKNANHQQAI